VCNRHDFFCQVLWPEEALRVRFEGRVEVSVCVDMMGDSEGVRERKVEGRKVITSNSTFLRRDMRWIEGQRGKVRWEGIKPQLQAATARPKLGGPLVELAASSEAWWWN
jgi:hypothetical protein